VIGDRASLPPAGFASALEPRRGRSYPVLTRSPNWLPTNFPARLATLGTIGAFEEAVIAVLGRWKTLIVDGQLSQVFIVLQLVTNRVTMDATVS
jgi:hypothetical protein